MRARPTTRRGFTLLELVFAIAIGAVVVAGLYSVFRMQMRQFVAQDLQMEMHQNGRMGLDILSRTARMAGYGTASGETRGIFGAAGNADDTLPAVISYNGTGPWGSDAITLVSMDPALVVNTAATQPPPCDTTVLHFDPAVLHNAARIAQYQANDLVLCYDYAGIGAWRSYLWTLEAAGNATSGDLAVSANTQGDYIAECSGTTNLPLVMVCSRAEVATFYIDADETDGIGPGSPDHPVLMMDLDFQSPSANDIPVVDNVEDMQVAYCLQGAGGTTDCSQAAAWQDSITTADVDDVYMMRLSLVIRASRPDLQANYVNQRPALEDNPGGSTVDNYYRQVVSTEVMVRNLRIQAQL
jgi:type IV pilus assembly protein PilW